MREFTGGNRLLVMICLVLTILMNVSVDAQQPTTAETKIQFHVSDSTGQAMPCRIHLQNEHGQPQKAVGQPFWHGHFVCNGRVAVAVAPGKYTWQVERGPEYERQSGNSEVAAGSQTTIDVTLSRIANLRGEGWYSGDLHVHRPLADIERLMQAEDIDFAPVITWWNSRTAWQNKLIPDETTRTFDRHRIYTVMAGEDEREGGELLYFGLSRPLGLPNRRASPEFPSPMRFVEDARQRNADVWIDIEKPFWWDVPTWLASGKMNSIGIANNHMCRSRMLANEAWGRPRDASRLPNPRGNGFWTQEIYYHALNAGLRIPPSAGSASGVLPNPVGYNRVYVYLGNENNKQTPCAVAKADGTPSVHATFDQRDWFAGLARGRCFVTNGPLLRMRANGQLPGATLKKSDDQDLPIELTVDLTSNDRVPTLEVIHNGRIVRTIECADELRQQKTIALNLSEPGWFLVRAIADIDHTFRFASTAPWYIESDSVKHRISKASAQFFHDWVDERIQRVRDNVSNGDQLKAVLKPHEEARQFWAGRIQRANADLD